MQTLLKAAVAETRRPSSSPALGRDCPLATLALARLSTESPAPLDAAGTQPSTQPVPEPPIIIDGINGRRG